MDSPRVLEGFAMKHGLRFPLASDQERDISSEYGVLKENSSLSAARVTFVLDPAGNVVLAYPKVKAGGHAAAVLADVTAAREAGRL